MAIRKILLPLAGVASARSALATGLMIAKGRNAHLYALHVRTDTRDVAPLAGEGLSGAMIEDMMKATEREGQSEAQALEALFKAMAEEAGVTVGQPGPASAPIATAQFESIMGREEDITADEARLADLIVVPHPKSADDVASADALHAVLFDSGRPALIAPTAEPAGIGARIAIGWNGTAESASAVGSALPWLREAEAVRIFFSPEYQRQGPSAARLVEFLALHGVTADTAQFATVDRSVGAGLLSAASDFGADLLAMGAYSHSRLRQLILGGVTRHVLANAHLPVLMNR